MSESSVWIYSLQSVLTPVTIWATCFAQFFFWMMHLNIYYLAEIEFSIIFHFKIYVSCLEPSFDFKGWWVEMSSLHCVKYCSCTRCLAIDYFQSQRHLLTEKIYHSIRLWVHDSLPCYHIDHPINFPFMISLNKKKLGVCATVLMLLDKPGKIFIRSIIFFLGSS